MTYDFGFASNKLLLELQETFRSDVWILVILASGTRFKDVGWEEGRASGPRYVLEFSCESHELFQLCMIKLCQDLLAHNCSTRSRREPACRSRS